MEANLERFHWIRMQTLAMLDGLSQEQLDFLPAEGERSVGELMDHLILAEKFVRGEIAELVRLARAGQEPYLYRSFADFNARPSFLPQPLLPLFEGPFNVLNSIVPGFGRDFLIRFAPIPVQSADVLIPRKGRARQELRDELGSGLQQTEALFAANADLEYARMVQRHPIFGAQNVPRLLKTLGLHEQSHQDQIAIIFANPRFKGAG